MSLLLMSGSGLRGGPFAGSAASKEIARRLGSVEKRQVIWAYLGEAERELGTRLPLPLF